MGGGCKFLKHAVPYCFISACEYVTPKNTENLILYIDSPNNLNLHFISTVTLLFLMFDATEYKFVDNDHNNTFPIL